MSGIGPLVEITDQPYEPERFIRRLDCGDAGALVTFTGFCRSEDGRLKALELEHYAGMGERMLERIARDCVARHSLMALGVIHRYGLIEVGEPIVTVAAAARHRMAAFAGAEQLMDYLKTDAPFWKKEHPVDGSPGGWVAEADRDKAARSRWDDGTSRKA